MRSIFNMRYYICKALTNTYVNAYLTNHVAIVYTIHVPRYNFN